MATLAAPRSKPTISLSFVEQGSDEWLQEREGKYSGSNAYKLLGTIGVKQYALAELASWGGNFWTKRGHLLEDQAISLVERIKGVNIIRNEEGVKVGIVTNSLFPNCIYSPDGLTEKVLLEVKSFDLPEHMKLVQAKSYLDIPLKITAQIFYGMLISGRRTAWLIAFNPKAEKVEDKLKIIVIKWQPEIANNFKRILGGINAEPVLN